MRGLRKFCKHIAQHIPENVNVVNLAMIAIVITSILTVSIQGGAQPFPRQDFYLSPSLACELGLLAPLRFTHMEHFDIEHRGPAGRVYHPWEQIPDLPSGKYLYFIYRNGDVAIQPIHDMHGYFENGLGVYTHANLVMDYVGKHGRNPRGRIIAAGEFIQAFGEVHVYTNRSGKWRGGPERVDLARRILSERGMVFTVASDPKRIGVDVEDLGHTKGARLADALYMWRMADVITHPYGHDRLLDLYERFGRLMKRYTDNGTASAEAIMKVLKAGLKGDERNDLQTFMWPIISACNNDGMAWGIYRIWDNITIGQSAPTNYLNTVAPFYLNRLLMSHGDRMTAADHAELVAIRDGFKNLPAWIAPTTPPIGPYFVDSDFMKWVQTLPVKMPDLHRPQAKSKSPAAR